MASSPLALADAAFVEEEYESALSLYTQAVKADPSAPAPLARRAACLLKLGRHALAAEDASSSAKISPSSTARRWEGLARFELGQFEQARIAFTAALELDPSRERVLRRWVRKCDAEMALPVDARPQREPAPNPAAPPVAGAKGASSGLASIAPAPPSDPSKIRHEWYQTQTHVVVSVLARNAPTDSTKVTFEEANARVAIDFGKAGGGTYELTLSLYSTVDPSECRWGRQALLGLEPTGGLPASVMVGRAAPLRACELRALDDRFSNVCATGYTQLARPAPLQVLCHNE
eukprot:scaffold93983_cov33-Tisochrysis_lutea.AAC.1